MNRLHSDRSATLGCSLSPRREGFSLVEILVATALFSLIVVATMSVLGQTTTVWRRSQASVEAFQSARIGFDAVTRKVSQMTLSTYLDYVDSANRFPKDSGYNNQPARYARQSDLHLMCARCGVSLSDGSTMPGTNNTGTAAFFQIPAGYTDPAAPAATSNIGLDSALNTCGFYVEFSSDKDLLPPHVKGPEKFRYRLKQLLVPTESNSIFSGTSPYKWFIDFTNPSASPKYAYPVASNIIVFVLMPQDPSSPALLGNDYKYDSRENANTLPQPVTANQMPPVMNVTMVAIDEKASVRYDNGATEPAVIKAALQDKFVDSTKLDEDLNHPTKGLLVALTNARISYRVFSSAVPVRGAKWTK